MVLAGAQRTIDVNIVVPQQGRRRRRRSVRRGQGVFRRTTQPPATIQVRRTLWRRVIAYHCLCDGIVVFGAVNRDDDRRRPDLSVDHLGTSSRSGAAGADGKSMSPKMIERTRLSSSPAVLPLVCLGVQKRRGWVRRVNPCIGSGTAQSEFIRLMCVLPELRETCNEQTREFKKYGGLSLPEG